jgi:hypothetical protein
MRTRLRSLLERSLVLLAAALALSLALAAWRDVSKAWDTWAYHLPFAARIAGIVGPESYAFGRENAARFSGFPLAIEALQGLLWRLTGRPECANFVALGSVFAFVGYLWKRFRVPAPLALFALLAVPLVQIHATQCYVDLPANVGASVLLLEAYGAWARPTGARPMQALFFPLGVAIVTGNAKFQLLPIVLLAWTAIVLRARAWERASTAALAILGSVLVLLTPVANVVRHHNPFWPVELTLFGHPLPFAETRYASSPKWLASAIGPVRFGASVLELGVDRWSVDQWTPPDHPGYRMGGFFGPYVVVLLAALAFALVLDWRRTEAARDARATIVVFGATTVVVALLPQCHELRYYLCWMLLLVAFATKAWARRAPLTSAAVALTALVWVAWSTRGAYLRPSGESFAELVASRVDRSELDRAASAAHATPNARLCVSKEPWTFLHAPTFHPGARFRIQEASTPEECP